MRKAFWGARFEGKEGSARPIITKDDFTKGPGDTINNVWCINLAKCWKLLRAVITTKVKILRIRLSAGQMALSV